jgi:hypothetical protein
MKKITYISAVSAGTLFLTACGDAEDNSEENVELNNEAEYTEENSINEEPEEEPADLEEENEENWFHDEEDVESDNNEETEGTESTYNYGAEELSLLIEQDDGASLEYDYENTGDEPTGIVTIIDVETTETEGTEAVNEIEEMMQEIQVLPDSDETTAQEEILNYLEMEEEAVAAFELSIEFSDEEQLEVTH